MNSPCRRVILAPLLAVVAMLLGLGGTASAAFNPAATEAPLGNFLLWELEASLSIPLELADPSKEIGVWAYDDTLGVPVYVRQNPWSGYDPQGLFVRWLVEKVNTHVFDPTVGRAGRWIGNQMSPGQATALVDSGVANAVDSSLGTAQAVVHGALDFTAPGSGTLDTVEAGGSLGDVVGAAANDFGGKKIRTAMAVGQGVKAGLAGDAKGVLSAGGELLIGKATKGNKPGGKSARNTQANSQAAAERAKNLEKGIPANQLGPSGKPKVHTVKKPTDKRAQEAARQHGKRKPEKHTQDAGQPTHYHGTDRAGEKLKGKDNVHFEERGGKPNPPKVSSS